MADWHPSPATRTQNQSDSAQTAGRMATSNATKTRNAGSVLVTTQKTTTPASSAPHPRITKRTATTYRTSVPTVLAHTLPTTRNAPQESLMPVPPASPPKVAAHITVPPPLVIPTTPPRPYPYEETTYQTHQYPTAQRESEQLSLPRNPKCNGRLV